MILSEICRFYQAALLAFVHFYMIILLQLPRKRKCKNGLKSYVIVQIWPCAPLENPMGHPQLSGCRPVRQLPPFPGRHNTHIVSASVLELPSKVSVSISHDMNIYYIIAFLKKNIIGLKCTGI